MSTPITLDSLNTMTYTKKEIQDENVQYGLARCENELKEKSVRKLRDHLHELSLKKDCVIQLDDDLPRKFVYPPGKNRNDFTLYLSKFFEFNSTQSN